MGFDNNEYPVAWTSENLGLLICQYRYHQGYLSLQTANLKGMSIYWAGTVSQKTLLGW